MKLRSRTCPYCKEKFEEREIDTHIEIEHNYEMLQSNKRLKIGLTFSLIGFCVVIGMILGGLL